MDVDADVDVMRLASSSDGALVLLLTADDFDFLEDKKKDDGKMHVIFGKGAGSPSPRVVFVFASRL